MKPKSKPYLSAFSPNYIPYQREVVNLINTFDYRISNLEILLSGAYGSSKSVLMAHLAVVHCLKYKMSRVCLCRRSMPDLKDTIFKEVLEHISHDLKEGTHYFVNTTRGSIRFQNGSEIISRSWADKKYYKSRSINLSMAIFEELTENSLEDKIAFDTIKARIRRLPHVPENVLIAATNPDGPGHWVAKYWHINDEKDRPKNRKVFYSVTTDNPFLDPVYIRQLKADLAPKEAQRYIYGQWVDIDRERVYYAYDPEKNRRAQYVINRSLPIIIAFDFNIGFGKPMSSCAIQVVPNDNSNDGLHTHHVFDEVVIEGARTTQVLEEWLAKGVMNKTDMFLIRGDASGRAKDTRSIRSDYDLIKDFLTANGIRHELQVASSNPPIRTRHNVVNALFKNELGQHRAYVYDKAKTVHEGFLGTALKKGADYIEDDSLKSQHITTAFGYSAVYERNMAQTTHKGFDR